MIWAEIKKGLNSSNAWFHSVQSLLSSHLLSKNVKIRIYKTVFWFYMGVKLCLRL
jgi:hypothetical protein